MRVEIDMSGKIIFDEDYKGNMNLLLNPLHDFIKKTRKGIRKND